MTSELPGMGALKRAAIDAYMKQNNFTVHNGDAPRLPATDRRQEANTNALTEPEEIVRQVNNLSPAATLRRKHSSP